MSLLCFLIVPLDDRRGLRIAPIAQGVLAAVYLLKENGRWIEGRQRIYRSAQEAEEVARAAFQRAATRRRAGAPADDRVWDVEDP